MIKELIKFKIYLESSQINKAFDVILANSLLYYELFFEKNGDAVLIVPSSLRNIYKDAFYENDIVARIGNDFGISEVLFRYKKRYGIIIGLFLMMITIYASTLFVWDIRIEGNCETDDSKIIDILNECGFCLGSYIPKINYDKLHNDFLLKSDSISWISVNIEGNIAKVIVKENIKGQTDSKKSYSNVVAKCDGQISLVRVFDGVKTVKILDIVKKGDILISGIIDSQSEGVRYVHADGIVNAYVNKHISIKIPMNDRIKSLSGVIHTDKYIKIFSKKINIFKKGRNLDSQCDKIEKSEEVVLFGRIKLPIVIVQTRYFEYEYNEVNYSEREARDIALIKLRNELDTVLESAEILSKKINYFCDYEYYYIECDLYCMEDIAKVVEFQVVEK